MNLNYFENQLNKDNEYLSMLNESEDIFFNEESDIYAEGAEPQYKVDESDPFIISLSNSSGAAISDVSFLYPVNGIKAGATNYGINSSVTVSYDVPDVDYEEFLWSIYRKPVIIGLTRIKCADSQSQLSSSIKIETSNVRGKGGYQTFTPQLNSFQNQDYLIDMNNRFILNGRTRLTLGTLEDGVTVTFSMYPLKEASSLDGLESKSAHKYRQQQLSGLKVLGK